MSRYLDPKADVVFKKIFGEHPEVTDWYRKGLKEGQAQLEEVQNALDQAKQETLAKVRQEKRNTAQNLLAMGVEKTTVAQALDLSITELDALLI